MSVELNLSAWRRRKQSLGCDGIFAGTDSKGNPTLVDRQEDIVDLNNVSELSNGSGGNGHRNEDPFGGETIHQASKVEEPSLVG